MPEPRAGRVAAFPAELQEQLRHRLSGRGRRAGGIPRAERTGPVPLSFAQQRLWFLTEFQPDDAEYNSGLALRLRGTLDEAALDRALGELVERHESLRTTFAELDGTPVQVVHPTGRVPVERVALAEPARLDAVLADAYARPFDPRPGPLVRALLGRPAPPRHVLPLTPHPTATPRMSIGVLVQ